MPDILPRSLVPRGTSKVVRRGRWNAELLDGLSPGEGEPAPGGGSEPPTVPLANYKAEVKAYALANPVDFLNHCSNFNFLDGLVLALRALDERVGFCWRPERNNYAKDALCYYHGVLPPLENSPNVYVVDVISSSCSAVAAPAWIDVTTPAALRQWRQVRI